MEKTLISFFSLSLFIFASSRFRLKGYIYFWKLIFIQRNSQVFILILIFCRGRKHLYFRRNLVGKKRFIFFFFLLKHADSPFNHFRFHHNRVIDPRHLFKKRVTGKIKSGTPTQPLYSIPPCTEKSLIPRLSPPTLFPLSSNTCRQWMERTREKK